MKVNKMKLPKEKYAVAARGARRRSEFPVTKAQKDRKVAADAERLRKIQRTTDRNSERLRAKAERWSAAGAEGLAANASRNSTRRKLHPLTIDEKVEKARADTWSRSIAGVEFLAAEATRISARSKTNPLTAEQKA